MNRIFTDVDSFHTKRNLVAVAICLVLVCVVPYVSGHSLDNTEKIIPRVGYGGGDSERITPSEIGLKPHNYHFSGNHGHKSKIHENWNNDGGSIAENEMMSPGPNRFDNEEKKRNWKNSELHKKKNHFRNRPNKKQFRVDEQKDRKSMHNFRYTQSEKKYFDYFPIEEVELNYDPKEDNMEVILLNNEPKKRKTKKVGQYPKKHEGRKKRDISETLRTEEQSELQRTRRNSNLGIVIPPHPYSYNFQQQQPSRQYIPVQIGFGPKIPIPGNYYNTFSPSGVNIIPPPRPSPPESASHTKNDSSIEVAEGINNRQDFGDFGNDNPVWGVQFRPTPSSGRGTGNVPTASPVYTVPPTYRPTTYRPPLQDPNPEQVRPSSRRPPPPLIHGPTNNDINTIFTTTTARPFTGNQGFDNNQNNQGFNNQRPNNQGSNNQGPNNQGFNNQGGSSSNQGGFSFRTQPPPPPPTPRPQGPSKCVWAIVNCCAPNSLDVRYSCFERLGCSGAFWNHNPCADNLQNSAVDITDQFFDGYIS